MKIITLTANYMFSSDNLRSRRKIESTEAFVCYGPLKLTMEELPLHCLQRIVEPLGLKDRIAAYSTSQVLREAVQSSKWSCGKLVLNAEYIFPRLSQSALKVVGYAWLGDQFRLKMDTENGKAAIFLQIRRLFTRLHLEELKLENVPLDDELFQHFNDFLDDDGITFDRFTIQCSDDRILSERWQELIARAKEEVVYEAYESFINSNFVTVLKRPITFKGVGVNWDARAIISEDLFVRLIRKGHSFEGMSVNIRTTDVLGEVIERVSSSPIRQKINVCLYSLDFDFLVQYLERCKATEVHNHCYDQKKYWPWSVEPHERKIRTFKHLEVEIILATVEGVTKYARMVVKNEH